MDLEELITPQYKIVVVQEHDEGEQIRKHHKRRINKKWLKRYGAYGKQKINKDQILIFGDTIYMSRPHFRELKKEIKNIDNLAEIKADKKIAEDCHNTPVCKRCEHFENGDCPFYEENHYIPELDYEEDNHDSNHV